MKSNGEQLVPSARRGFLFLLLIIAGLAYGIYNRHWSDWILYSYIATVPFAYNLAMRETQYMWESTKTLRDKTIYFAKLSILPVPIIAIFLLPIGGVIYGSSAAFIYTFKWISLQLSQSGKSATLAAAVTALLGVIFFTFRLKFRFIYGITEAMVGLSVAGHRVGFVTNSQSTGDAELYLAVLTAGIYLVVRGLDNMHQGWITDSDAALKWLRRFSKKEQKNPK